MTNQPESNHSLKSYVERIERLNDERKATSDDIKDVYTEAASHGFDKKALRRVIRVRGQDKQKREEEEAIFETYAAELGLI